jgi:hypothetical protein
MEAAVFISFLYFFAFRFLFVIFHHSLIIAFQYEVFDAFKDTNLAELKKEEFRFSRLNFRL